MDTVGLSTTPAGNLPAALTSLVGRRGELRTITELFAGTRMLTLAGTGGCGKTRLGLALAQASGPQFPDGAWWIDLSSVSGSGVATGVAAAALGIAQSPGEDTAATVGRHLRGSCALLVFDNCEQVAGDCAALIDGLLRSCPSVKVLATSREVVGVPGELVFRVEGLRLPAEGTDVASAEAVQLFTERMRAAAPGFQLAPADLTTVARLCRRLDGLPLAIELAAARVAILGVSQIVERLDRDVRVLRHPSKTAPARHQTLEATLDWSHRLLTEAEQILLRRLSAFRGSFSLLAAEAVVTGAGIEPVDLVDVIAGLVDKSLLRVASRGAEYRYLMLETIREYAEAKLRDSGEEGAVHAAHAGFFCGLAEQARAGLDGSDQARWLERLELEHDNLRAVLSRAAAPGVGQPETGARLTALLWPFWYWRGYYDEARSWLEQAMGSVALPVSIAVRAAVLTGAGVLAFLQCDYPVATERLTSARELYEVEGDRVGLATTLQRLGSIAREQGHYDAARRLHEESLAIWSELGDGVGVAAAQDFLGFAAWLEGDAQRGIEMCGQAVAAFQAAGRRRETASALINLGVATHLGGDPERAAECVRAGLDIATEIRFAEGVAWALHELAVITAAGDRVVAAGLLRESLLTHVRLGDRWRVASVLETIAELVLAPRAGSAGPDLAGNPVVGNLVAERQLAAKLLGAGCALRRELGAPVPPAERSAYDACVTLLGASLGADGFAAAWQEGESAPLDQMVDAAARAMAAAGAGAVGQPDGRSALSADYGLTGREVAVLRLLSRGLTNREIGRELLISPGTAGVHVSNILRKLGVSGRVQAAGIAHQLGMGS